MKTASKIDLVSQNKAEVFEHNDALNWPKIVCSVGEQLERICEVENGKFLDCKQGLQIIHSALNLDACLLVLKDEDPDYVAVKNLTSDKPTLFGQVRFPLESKFLAAVANEPLIFNWTPLKRDHFPHDRLWEVLWQSMVLGPYAPPWHLCAASLGGDSDNPFGALILIAPAAPEGAGSGQEKLALRTIARFLRFAVEWFTHRSSDADREQFVRSQVYQSLLVGGQALAMHGVFMPLQTIELYIDLAEDGLQRSDRKDMAQLLNGIRGMVFEASRAAKNFLNAGGTSDDQPPVAHGPVSPQTWTDVRRLFEELERKLTPLAKMSQKTFVARIEEPASVRMDKETLDEVLINLLHNAIKYSHPATKIKFVLRHTTSKSYIEVTSYGIAVESEYKDRIFEKGFRTPSAIDKIYSAVGLGLFEARQLAKKAGAELALSGSTLIGNTFYGPEYRNTFRLRINR